MSRKLVFTEPIRRAVDQTGMGRNELARRAGIDKSHLSRFMSGKSFLSEDSLNRLAHVLGLRIVADAKARKGER